MQKFRKFWKYGFVRGSGAEPPEANENIKKSSREINEKLQNFETFHKILGNFYLKS